MSGLTRQINYKVRDAEARRSFERVERHLDETERSARTLGRAFDDAGRDVKDYGRQAVRANRDAGDSAKRAADQVEGLRGRFSNLVSTLKAFAAIALARLFTEGARAAFDMGTNVIETANKFSTVFGPATQQLDQDMKELARTMGLTQTEARGLVSTAGLVLQGLGQTRAESAATGLEMLRLAGDITSMSNVTEGAGRVMEAMLSAMVGEREAIKTLIGPIRETVVQKKALEMTGKANTKALTDEEKALATLAIMYDIAGAAVGDLERTKDQLVNRYRASMAAARQFAEELSVGLLPAFAAAIEATRLLTAGVEENGDTLGTLVGGFLLDFVELVFRAGTAVSHLVSNLLHLVGAGADVDEATGESTRAVDRMAGSLEGAAIFVGRLSGRLREFAADVSDVARDIVRSMATMVEAVAGAFGALQLEGELPGWLTRVAPNLQDIQDSINGFGAGIQEGVGGMADDLNEAAKQLDEFGTAQRAAADAGNERVEAQIRQQRALRSLFAEHRRNLAQLMEEGVTLGEVTGLVDENTEADQANTTTTQDATKAVRDYTSAYVQLVQAQTEAAATGEEAARAVGELFGRMADLRRLVTLAGAPTEEARGIMAQFKDGGQIVAERVTALRQEIAVLRERVMQEESLAQAVERSRRALAAATTARRPGAGRNARLAALAFDDPAAATRALATGQADVDEAQAGLQEARAMLSAFGDEYARLRQELRDGLDIETDTSGLGEAIQRLDRVEDSLRNARTAVDQLTGQAAMEATAGAVSDETQQALASARTALVELMGTAAEARQGVQQLLQVRPGDGATPSVIALREQLQGVLEGFQDAESAALSFDQELQEALLEQTEALAMGGVEGAVRRYEAAITEAGEAAAQSGATAEQHAQAVKDAQEALAAEVFQLIELYRQLGVLTPEIHAALVGALGTAGKDAGRLVTQTDKLVKSLRQFTRMGDGLLRLADAMGVLSDQAAGLVGGLLDAVDAVGQLQETQQQLQDDGVGLGSLQGLVAQAPAALGILGGVAGAVTSFADAINRRREQERAMQKAFADAARSFDNAAQALTRAARIAPELSAGNAQRLRDAVEATRGIDTRSQRGDLAANASSIQAIEDLLRTLPGFTNFDFESAQQEYRRATGDFSLEGFYEHIGLFDILNDLADAHGGFADTVGGAIAEVERFARYLGEEGTASLQRFLDALLSGATAGQLGDEATTLLQEARALDLSTAAGQQRLREIVAALAALPPGAFPGMTPAEFDSILDTLSGLAGGPGSDTSVVRGVQQVRTITEFQASEVVAILHESLRELRAQTAILEGGGIGGPLPPVLPLTAARTLPSTSVNITLNVYASPSVRSIMAEIQREIERAQLFRQ